MAGSSKPIIGILALQGDVDKHKKRLNLFGVKSLTIKMPEQLRAVDGLIIPGGESTALLKLARPVGMLEAIAEFASSGGKIFGTCAGAILLARKVANPPQQSLELIDIDIRRNAYGRQLDSVEAEGQALEPLKPGTMEMTFIRAPKVTRTGKGVRVLARYKRDPVLLEQDNILVATFHPELAGDYRVHKYWLNKIR